MILFDPRSPSDPMIPSHLSVQWTCWATGSFESVGSNASIGSNELVGSKEPVSYNDPIRPIELFGSDEHFPFGFNDPDRTTGPMSPLDPMNPFGPISTPSGSMSQLDPRS